MSKGSQEVSRLAPVVLEMMYVLSDEKAGRGRVSVTSLQELVGESRWPVFDATLKFLREQELIGWRLTPARHRKDIFLTVKGADYLLDNFVEEEDKTLYRALREYIDAATLNAFYRLKLARLLRHILTKYGGADKRVNLHGVEDQLGDFLRSRRYYESNEWFHRLALSVVNSEPTPVMGRCLGVVVDRLFDVAYAATYFKKGKLRRLYLSLCKLSLHWSFEKIIIILWSPLIGLITLHTVAPWLIAQSLPILVYSVVSLCTAITVILLSAHSIATTIASKDER